MYFIPAITLRLGVSYYGVWREHGTIRLKYDRIVDLPGFSPPRPSPKPRSRYSQCRSADPVSPASRLLGTTLGRFLCSWRAWVILGLIPGNRHFCLSCSPFRIFCVIWGRSIFGYFPDVGRMDIYRFTDILRCGINGRLGYFLMARVCVQSDTFD